MYKVLFSLFVWPLPEAPRRCTIVTPIFCRTVVRFISQRVHCCSQVLERNRRSLEGLKPLESRPFPLSLFVRFDWFQEKLELQP